MVWGVCKYGQWGGGGGGAGVCLVTAAGRVWGGGWRGGGAEPHKACSVRTCRSHTRHLLNPKYTTNHPICPHAGLICGRRYQGRRTPLKGKGTPPPDHKEEQFVAAKHMVPGKSFTPSL